MYNELNKHKNSDKLKWWLTLIAFLLMGVTIGGMLLGYIKPMEQPVNEPVQQEQEVSAESGGYNTEFVNTNGIKLFSATPMKYSRTTGTATKQIYATIQPATASNKDVSWTIDWETQKEQLVTDYVTVEPTLSNPLIADVTCYAPFDGNIVITVTTLEGNYSAQCIVAFVGQPTEILIDTIVANDGTNYNLGLNGTFTLNVEATNPFGQIGADYSELEVTLWCSGSVTKGTYTYDYWEQTWSWENEETVALNTLLDRFIVIEYNDGVITLSTGNKEIAEYYEKYTNIDGGRTRYYSNKIKEVGEDCKIGLTIREPNSGLNKIIYLNLDKTAVSNVSVTPEVLF